MSDELFTDAERLAKRLNTSRSRLYAGAMRDYLARHDPDAITEALNRVCDVVESRSDPAIAAAAGTRLARVEW